MCSKNLTPLHEKKFALHILFHFQLSMILLYFLFDTGIMMILKDRTAWRMEQKIHGILELLKGLSKGQCDRLIECIENDQGLVICVGSERASILRSVKDIQSIVNTSNNIFISELMENEQFAITFKSVIYRIIAPDDNLMDFLDFRMENWPEE